MYTHFLTEIALLFPPFLFVRNRFLYICSMYTHSFAHTREWIITELIDAAEALNISFIFFFVLFLLFLEFISLAHRVSGYMYLFTGIIRFSFQSFVYLRLYFSEFGVEQYTVAAYIANWWELLFIINFFIYFNKINDFLFLFLFSVTCVQRRTDSPISPFQFNRETDRQGQRLTEFGVGDCSLFGTYLLFISFLTY